MPHGTTLKRHPAAGDTCEIQLTRHDVIHGLLQRHSVGQPPGRAQLIAEQLKVAQNQARTTVGAALEGNNVLRSCHQAHAARPQVHPTSNCSQASPAKRCTNTSASRNDDWFWRESAAQSNLDLPAHTHSIIATGLETDSSWCFVLRHPTAPGNTSIFTNHLPCRTRHNLCNDPCQEVCLGKKPGLEAAQCNQAHTPAAGMHPCNTAWNRYQAGYDVHASGCVGPKYAPYASASC